jgi:hypothetical protein
MKHIILCMVFVLIISCINQKAKKTGHSDFNKIDSTYREHLQKLKNIIEDGSLIEGAEELQYFNNILSFFEKITRIRSQRIAAAVGYMYYRETAIEEDYIKWRKWYDENKGSLKWDSINEKIIKK